MPTTRLPALKTLVAGGALLAGLALLAFPASAQQAALVGVLGSKALLVIDGNAPRTLGAGDSASGVKVVSVGSESAVIEADGARQTLRLGDTPVFVSGSRAGTRQKLVLRADSRGHFVNSGLINGKVIQYMIDTGATTVALSKSDAQRIGLQFEQGQPVMLATGNGNVQGWRIMIESIRVGDIELRNVESVVIPQPMPYVLLGNSFLNAFQMSRSSNEMVLERR